MADHPGDHELIAYADEVLDGADATRIAAHLGRCTACAGTVARLLMLREAVRADVAFAPSAAAISGAKALFAAPRPAARDMLEPLRRIVAQLVFDSGSALSPALAGFRGGGDRHLTYETESIEVDIQVQPVEGAGEDWTILGQVATENDEAPAVLELVIANDDAAVATATSDANGMFRFAGPAGWYDVIVRFPDRIVVLPGVELGRDG